MPASDCSLAGTRIPLRKVDSIPVPSLRDGNGGTRITHVRDANGREWTRMEFRQCSTSWAPCRAPRSNSWERR